MTRSWIFVAVLVLTPLAVYRPTVFHEYGFRDDYADLREAREVPQNLFRFTSSLARPLYGALLIATVRPLGGVVENLRWLRLGSVLLLGLLGIALWRVLVRSRWPPVDAAAVALIVTLLPAAQITVAWAIAWPIALSLLLSVAGFRMTEAALGRRGASRAALWLAAGSAYGAAALTYQPSALFLAVPLAAALLLREDPVRSRAAWTAAHLVTVAAALLTGFVAMKLVFALELAPQSGLIAFEHDPIGKLAWFLSASMANALALIVVRDQFETSFAFWAAALAVAALIVAGLWLRKNRGAGDCYSVSFCVLVLPFVAYAVNLVVGARVQAYRTTYALAGLVVVLVIYSLRQLHAALKLSRTAHYGVLAALALAGAVLANRHAYELIAMPQGFEWSIMRDAVQSLELGTTTRVYVIRPTLEDRATRRVFADEFGSLSSDSDWAAAEMFRSALRLRFPHGLPADLSYTFASGSEVPWHGAFDAVIDMRRLREHRHD